MRIVASLVAAAALMGVSSIAYAATAVGDITSINMAKHSLTFGQGFLFRSAEGRRSLPLQGWGKRISCLRDAGRQDGRHSDQARESNLEEHR